MSVLSTIKKNHANVRINIACIDIKGTSLACTYKYVSLIFDSTNDIKN